MGLGDLSGALVQGLVAALAVELLVRAWRVREPGARVHLRLLVVFAPALLAPALPLLAPLRQAPPLSGRGVLLQVGRWQEVGLGPLPLTAWVAGGLGALGLALFLRDAVPFLREGRVAAAARRRPWRRLPQLEARVAAASARLGVSPPALVVLDAARPLLMVRGLRRPTLVVSRGAVRTLDAEALDAALAHELAHLRHGDLWLGWALWVARALQALNPAVQVVARVVARDLERRADDTASRATGRPLALASALVTVFRGARGQRPAGGLGRALARAHEDVIAERCRRLLDAPPPPPVPLARARLVAAALTVALLLSGVT